MIEDLDTAIGDLKRADHLLYVTLKYTRTTEVIKNIIKRLLGVYDLAVLDILEVAKRKGKLDNIPSLPVERISLLTKVFPRNKAIKDYVLLYFVMNSIRRSKYKSVEEYRKKVTLITEDFIVDVPLLHKYYNKTKEVALFSREYVMENEK